MLITTAIGFILACIPSAFMAVILAKGQPDKVPITFFPVLIAGVPATGGADPHREIQRRPVRVSVARLLGIGHDVDRIVLFPRRHRYVDSGVPRPQRSMIFDPSAAECHVSTFGGVEYTLANF